MKTRFRFLFFLVPVAFAGLGALALMYVWNWLMPGLFGVGMISFLQALGIIVLIRILTWGGGWGRWWYWKRYHYAAYGCGPYSHRYKYWQLSRERWEQMTPEEKEKFRARCGYPDKEEPVKA